MTLCIAYRNSFCLDLDLSSMGMVKMAEGSSNFSSTNWESPPSVRVYPARVYFNPEIATISPADISNTGTYWLALTR